MKLLHECLVRSAREYPGNIAVVDQAGSCSYAELDARAEAYAGLLVALGVGRGERILLWAEKSVELPALMQGALRQGVVYVPVDPLGPVSRLEKILADSGASLVFSTASRLADLDALERRPRIVVLDDPACPLHWSHVELPASASAPEEIGEHDLAYILYTSGSTGTPKGVALSHRNALAFVEWANERFAFEARDRFSNHAPFHFDLSVLDLYCAFSRGAAVCLVPEGIAFSPALLTAFLQEQRISVWYSVPSVLLMMMRDGNLLQSCPDSSESCCSPVSLFRSNTCVCSGKRSQGCAWPTCSVPPRPMSAPVTRLSRSILLVSSRCPSGRLLPATKSGRKRTMAGAARSGRRAS